MRRGNPKGTRNVESPDGGHPRSLGHSMIRVFVGRTRSAASAALPITIGRDVDNDIPLDDTKLSRRHCRIVRSPDGFVLEDMESSNGSYVNGERADRQILAAGDTVYHRDDVAAGGVGHRRRAAQAPQGDREFGDVCAS